jgi:hypothetical protein
MSANYDKYRAMTPEQLQKAIDERQVTIQYLNWLGIKGPGEDVRRILASEKGHIDVSAEGVRTFVHADGSRTPIPENYDNKSTFKATRIK